VLSRRDALKNLKLKARLNETGPEFIHSTQVYQYICVDQRLKIPGKLFKEFFNPSTQT